MKKYISKKSFFVLALLIGISFGNGSKCFSQGWQFAKSQGGNGDDGGRITTTDPSGNVYVAGTFYSASLPIGTLTPLTNAGVGTSDAFLAKFDANGNALWSQRIGGAQYDDISGITLDPTGQIWVTGSFNSTLISVPPATMGNSNSTGNFYDGYIAVFSSIGSCQGLVAFGGAGDQYATGCVFSGSQNCLYVTGHYATPTMTVAPTTLTNTSASGKYDVFLARFTTAGTVTWAKTTGGINSDDRVSSISVDASGFPYIGGTFSPNLVLGNTVIGTTTLTSLGMQDIFMAKYNTAGVFQWAQGIGSNQGGDYLTDLKIDGANNICISGYYQLSTLNVSTITLPNSGGYDAFIAKYSSVGAVQWANKIGAAFDEYGYGLDVDGSNNIYLAGAFNSTAVAVGTTTLANTTTTISYSDAFVTKYNSTGAPQWAVNPHGNYNEVGYDVSSDVLGNVYVVGQFNVAGPTAFGTTTLTSAGLYDSFLAKIGCLTATIAGVSNVCAGISATLVAGGATSYSWSTGATTSSIIITPTASAIYTVSGTTGSCTGVSNPYTVTLLPASVNTGGNLNLLCNQKQIINASCIPSNPTSVVWTPTIGLSSSTVLTPSVNAPGPSTQYTVTANLNNGCVAKGVITVTQFAPTPNICMVTVDSIGVNNLILWDKTAYPDADTFFVYRDISNNNYKLIGKVLPSAPYGEFQDTVRSLYAANGDPNASAWRYKIAYRDSCGNLSAQSPYHKTIFMQNNSGNFTWNDYQIEGQSIPVPVLSNYIFRRDNLGNGNWQNIQTLSSISTAYTDPSYSSFVATADWRAETVWGLSCNSSYLKSPLAAVKRSKSNLSNNKMIGLKENNLEKYISVFPNPANELLMLNFRSNDNYDVTIINSIGQEIYHSKNNSGNIRIDVKDLAEGFYNIKITTVNGSLNKKIIIE